MRKQTGKNNSRRGTSSNPDKPRVEARPHPLLRIIKDVARSQIESGQDLGKPLARNRWLIVNKRPSVYQLRIEPPTFMFLESYPGLPPILSELRLPKKLDAIYYSTFLKGGDYAGAKGKAYEESQRFTVELFGAYLKSESIEAPFRKLAYSVPKQWRDSNETIALLRTRVYLKDPTELMIAPDKPISEDLPWFPYLESRWHPRHNEVVLLGGLRRFRYSFSMLKEFYDYAISILHEDPIKYGRPEMDKLKFYEDAVRIHHRLWVRDGSPPGMKQVALEMGVTYPTFKSRWKKTEAGWTRIPPPLELMEDR